MRAIHAWRVLHSCFVTGVWRCLDRDAKIAHDVILTAMRDANSTRWQNITVLGNILV